MSTPKKTRASNSKWKDVEPEDRMPPRDFKKRRTYTESPTLILGDSFGGSDRFNTNLFDIEPALCGDSFFDTLHVKL